MPALRPLSVAGCVVLLSTVLAACSSGGSSGGSEQTDITVTWSAGSGATAPLWLAASEGFFSNHGLKVNVVQTGSTAGATAVIGGKSQFFYGEATSAFQAVAQHQPVEIVGMLRTKNVFKFYVGPTIKQPSDLAGKSLAISSVGDSTDLSTRAALDTLEVDPSSVTLLPSGTSTLRLTALVTGHVAGTLLTEPTASQAAQQGMRLILDQTTQPFAGSAISISKSFGQANPKTVVAFMEALEDGVHFLDDPANKTEVLSVMAKNLDGKPTDAAVQLQYTTYDPDGALAHDPYPDDAAGQAVVDALKSEDSSRFGSLALSQVYDSSFATTLRSSGYLTTLWGASPTSSSTS